MKILVVGDAHVNEHHDNIRFKWLSKFIVDNKPDSIVLMGDFMTMNCFSAWDRNKRSRMEGRRYQAEIKSGNEALDFMLHDLVHLNKNNKRSKKKVYSPQLIYLMGNHEDRLDRYIENYPELKGIISIEKDLKLYERGFKVIPYKKYIYINDIGFTHVPFNKVAAISGQNITHKAQNVTVKSVVFGHTHELHVSNKYVEGMEHLQQTLNCGCFFEQDEDYVEGKMTQYWKGVILLDSYKPGRFDITTYAMGKLEREYNDD